MHELMKESCLQFTTSVIVDQVTLEDFIQLLEDECPEAIDRSIVEYLVKNMSDPVKIRFNDVAMEL